MQYGWRVATEEVFGEQLKKLHSPEEVNRLYWHYMVRNIEAYDVILVWRSMELLKPALYLLNEREIIAPAVLSRSLLELAVTAILKNNMIYDLIGKVIEQLKTDEHQKIIISEELEDFIARMLFGTRLDEPPEKLKQRNVLTDIKHLLDNLKKNQPNNPAVTELMPVYNRLCEFAHPNLLGNIQFWSKIEAKNKDGSEIWRIERRARAGLVSSMYKECI
ncbi:MAG: hypothetical protein QXR97_07220 [Thermoproteota archaeon]